MIMTQEVQVESVLKTRLVMENVVDETEHEEGEILEDGEIADDEEDCLDHSMGNHHSNHMANVKGFEGSKENDKEGNNNIKNGGVINSNNKKFGGPPSYSNSYFPPINDRDEIMYFGKGPKRKKRGDRSKKRKLCSNNIDSSPASTTTKRKFSTSPVHESTTSGQQQQQSQPLKELIDISQYLNDSSFDVVELSDENEFNFELIEFDVFMEILGCKIIDEEQFTNDAMCPPEERSKLMCRIVKIMKKLHGNDPDITRRFARLKRRSREKQQQISINGSTKNLYKTPCRFYLEGKCHKGSDCLYSHDVPIPKRKELCKFYLQGFCGKGDDCLFMHSEFPCKFFHTNTKCYAGENCRFSHQPLTEETREILRNYLDSGTFPDEVKPYRPSNHEWVKDDDPDSNDFDYDGKTRPVLLGPATDKMKKSIETWKWQQELKEAEKAYTGTKRNLFSIDEKYALTEKPPTPRIEDDEEEIEAHIRNYYNDLLDTDEYDEMMHAKEIEELESKIKKEEDAKRLNEQQQTTKPPELDNEPKPPEISEEEQRLLKASELDEDLRILQPFTLPPAFQNSAVPATISTPIAPILSQTPQYNSFNSPRQNIPNTFNSNLPDISMESKPVTGFSATTVPNNNKFEPLPTNPMTVPPIVNNQQSTVPRDPRIRDPRLNNSNRLVPNNTGTSNISNANNMSTTVTSNQKPEIRVIKSNPNLVIKYKLFVIKIEPINYSAYYDLYQNDSSLKNDPRLKRFFTNAPISTTELEKQSGTTEKDFFTSVKTSNENVMALPSLTILGNSQKSTTNVSITSNRIIKTESPPSTVTTNKSDTPGVTNRDPRMKSRDVDHRNSIDNKNSDSNTSIISTNSTDQNKSDWEATLATKQENNVEQNNQNSRNSTTNNHESINSLSSIPSYSLSTSSLFNLVKKNQSFDESNKDENDKPDEDEGDDQLKVDENHIESESNDPSNDYYHNDNNSNNNYNYNDNNNVRSTINQMTESLWPSNIINTNIIDSDNEMEIDLQHPNITNNESESEYENELIIATSSSETEEFGSNNNNQLQQERDRSPSINNSDNPITIQ